MATAAPIPTPKPTQDDPDPDPDPELARVFAAGEKFSERERRTRAAVVLESEEVLVWWAMERDEVRFFFFYTFIRFKNKNMMII